MDCDPIIAIVLRANAFNYLVDYIEKGQQIDSSYLVNSNVLTPKSKSWRLETKEHNMSSTKPVSKSNLLQVLLNLVCRNQILSYLPVNDLLRLRRVCKSSKTMAEDFIRTKKVHTRRPLKIRFWDPFPFQKCDKFQNVDTYLPIRSTVHLSLCNSALVLKAPATFTNHVTHLTIDHLQLSRKHTSILLFLESFPNLTHLELDHIQAHNHNWWYSRPIEIPSTFRNLKSLKIPHWFNSKLHLSRRGILDTFTYTQALLNVCLPNLEQLLLPFDQFLLDNRIRKADIIHLACLCIFSETNLKLEGVTGKFLTELLREHDRTPEMRTEEEMIKSLNEKVVSFQVPQAKVFLLHLPNLEKIELSCVVEDMVSCIYPYRDILRIDWTTLKEIEVHLDDHLAVGNTGLSLRQLWIFLFVRIVRLNLVKLCISYTGLRTLNQVSVMRTMDIATNCPNLKTLHVGYGVINLVNLSLLWRGLGRLENLRFVGCEMLIDEHFVGKDDNNPAFWKLKNLKVFEFCDMNGTEVTDKLFKKVISHMPLKKVHLDCNNYDGELKSITMEGMQSLLGGKLASTVEKLSIKYLRIPGVTIEQLKNLKSKFRCSQMR